MSAAAVALKAAMAAGVTVSVDGNDLVVEADAEPPAALLNALKCHKSKIARLLLGGRGERKERVSRRKAACPLGSAMPPQWAEAFAALALSHPIEGVTPHQWRQLIQDAEHFLDQWAPEAARQGWNVLDAFGVHLRAPAARFDGMGLVPLIGGGKIVAIAADRATIRMPSGSELTVLKRPLQNAVPIWTLARPTGEPDGELQPVTEGAGDDGE